MSINRSFSVYISGLILAILFSSGCISNHAYISNRDFLDSALRKAAAELGTVLEDSIDDGSSVRVENLNPLHDHKKLKTASKEYEKNMRIVLKRSGFIPMASGDHSSFDDLMGSDYILKFRTLKYFLQFEHAADAEYVDRKTQLTVMTRLIDTASLDIILSDTFVTAESDRVSKRHLRYAGGERPFEAVSPITGSASGMSVRKKRFGLGASIAAGPGIARWGAAGYSMNLSIIYRSGKRKEYSFNSGFHSFERRLKSQTEKFKGSLFPFYISGEFKVFSTGRISIGALAGSGIYMFVADIEDLILEKSYSGSEVVLGISTGIKLKMNVSGNISADISSTYHYTGYEHIRDFAYIQAGLICDF